MAPMENRLRRYSAIAVPAVLVALAVSSARGQTQTAARVARLSFSQGTVTTMPASLPDQWFQTSVNGPIQQGDTLATAGNSFAEVELEDGSTVRLGERSQLTFNHLSASVSGSSVNLLTLENGYATFHFISGIGTVNEVQARKATISPSSPAEFRIDFNPKAMRVEVFAGSVLYSGPQGNVQLAPDNVLVAQPGLPNAISNGIARDSWDDWVEQRDQERATAQSAIEPSQYASENDAESDTSTNSGTSASLYGWNDLSDYGYWTYFGGYGYGWCPYVSYGWSPYSTGRWVWYSGLGSTWVSAEPWGWLPFHYGRWRFMPGFGWVWLPGSLNNWSPATVKWYEGPGWIGWTPRLVSQGRCSQLEGCFTAMSLEAFQSGTPVSDGHTVQVSLSQGHGEKSPTVKPAPLATLPRLPQTATEPEISTDTAWQAHPAPQQGLYFRTPAAEQHSREAGNSPGASPAETHTIPQSRPSRPSRSSPGRSFAPARP